tara:strand:+ start:133 stop:684 length:552 start_codon:yes stop_codon:yes gene_type:complete
MGKGNDKKGGKNKKRGKRNRFGVQHQRLITRTDDQQYAIITKMLGDCRVSLRYINDDGRLVETMGIIRGKLRKRVWMNEGSVVLVAERDFDKRVDIIDKYSDDNVRKLKRRGEIHSLLLDGYAPNKKTEEADDEDDIGFDFYGEDEAEAVKEIEVVTERSVTETLNDVDLLNDDTAEINWDEL